MQRTLASCLVAFWLVTVVASTNAQQWTSSIPNRACYSVAVNPLNRSVVYAGNVARTLFKSADGGTTWEEITIGSGGPGGGSLITTVVVHPRDTSVLLVGGTSFAGLDRSSDGGQTWTNVLIDPVGSRFEVASSAAIAVNGQYPDTIYVMRNNPPNLYRSLDAGKTWDSVGAITGLPNHGRIRALSMAPDSTNILLAGGRAAYIQRSTDNGKTWLVATNTLGLSDAEVANFVWSPSTPGKVYAVAVIQNTSSGGLHESTDWGLTWTTTRFRDTSLMALAVQSTRSGDEIFVGGNLLELHDGTLKGDSIIYRTPNGGTNWQSLDDVPWAENETGMTIANVWGFAVTGPDSYPEMLMASESGLFRSTFITKVDADPYPVTRRTTSGKTLPPTFDIVGHELRMTSGQGAKGAFRVDVISMTGSCLWSQSCEPDAQVVTLPSLALGCYIIQVVGDSAMSSSIVLL